MTEPPIEEVDRPWEVLERLLDAGDREQLASYLTGLGASDAARCIDRLDEEHRDLVLASLEPEKAAELLDVLAAAQGREMLEHSAPETVAAILEELGSDEQADILNSLEQVDAEAVLERMAPEAAESVRTLTSYPSDTAGGLMASEFLTFAATTPAAEVIEELRRQVDEMDDLDVQYIYVNGDDGALVGALPLRNLVLARSKRPIGEVMIKDPKTIAVTATLDELVDVFEETGFLGLPVVDEAHRQLGVVHRSDIDDAWDERAEMRRLKAQGIVGGEELRSMAVWRRSYRRLSWPSVNILLNVLAASVIASYQDTLSAVIALAVFLPIISDMSGCSGNQAVAVSMRELTLGIVKPVDVFYVWRKELAVGVLNGIVLGMLLAGTAWLWQGNAMLGAVVGCALALNTLVAVSIGGAVPLVLKRFNMDPALASGPILTTLTDMCGFFLVLSLAASAMQHLT